ncbi:hypothetical protein D3C81_1127750 [compost metagenome]
MVAACSVATRGAIAGSAFTRVVPSVYLKPRDSTVVLAGCTTHLPPWYTMVSLMMPNRRPQLCAMTVGTPLTKPFTASILALAGKAANEASSAAAPTSLPFGKIRCEWPIISASMPALVK